MESAACTERDNKVQTHCYIMEPGSQVRDDKSGVLVYRSSGPRFQRVNICPTSGELGDSLCAL
jgi:hypothetical protein